MQDTVTQCCRQLRGTPHLFTAIVVRGDDRTVIEKFDPEHLVPLIDQDIAILDGVTVISFLCWQVFWHLFCHTFLYGYNSIKVLEELLVLLAPVDLCHRLLSSR